MIRVLIADDHGVVRDGLGRMIEALPDMELVADVAKDYYNNDLRGGEGHMEVGKLIVNAVKSKAHITVSVKPFPCFTSSVSSLMAPFSAGSCSPMTSPSE